MRMGTEMRVGTEAEAEAEAERCGRRRTLGPLLPRAPLAFGEAAVFCAFLVRSAPSSSAARFLGAASANAYGSAVERSRSIDVLTHDGFVKLEMGGRKEQKSGSVRKGRREVVEARSGQRNQQEVRRLDVAQTR